MSLYAVRSATPAEREKVAASWRTMLTLPRGKEYIGLGKVDLARGWLSHAIADAVDKDVDGAVVLVADHPDAPGLPLGWAAYRLDPFTLLALHVNADARQQWVGRTLLRLLLEEHGSPRCAVMTPAGRRLLEHVQREMGQVAA